MSAVTTEQRVWRDDMIRANLAACGCILSLKGSGKGMEIVEKDGVHMKTIHGHTPVTMASRYL